MASPYYHSKKGVIACIYAQQRNSSKVRGHEMPLYDLLELREWTYSQKIFHELYASWIESGRDTKLRPSLDRLNDNLGYSFQNVQWITWEENDMKARDSRRSGSSGVQNKSIDMYTKSGEYITTYHSLGEASRATGIIAQNISKVTMGERKSAGGYSWKYSII